MNAEPIAALEVGTSRTVLAIGEPLSEERLRVAAITSIPSSGVHHSRIDDLKHPQHGIEAVIKKIEKEHGFAIRQAVLAVNGQQVKTSPFSTTLQIGGKAVTADDLATITNHAFDNGLDRNEREILDYAELGYGLDGEENISQPENMSGHVLRLDALFIHGDARRIADVRSAAAAAKIEITESYFAGSCAAAAVLSKADRENGALVLDLGGGSSAWTAWVNGKLRCAGVLGVGGDHVTEDIRYAFRLTRPLAEKIKTENASATLGGNETRVDIPSSTPGFPSTTISRRALETVVNARLRELFTIIREKLEETNVLHALTAGVILTGGGSAMRNTLDLASSVFGLPVRLGTPVTEIEGLERFGNPAIYATVAGLLLAAHRNTERPESLFQPVKNIFRRIFK